MNLWKWRITPIDQQIILQKDPESAKMQKDSSKAPDAAELYLLWWIIHMEHIRKHRNGINTFKKVIKKHHSFISVVFSVENREGSYSPMYSNPSRLRHCKG